MPARKLSYQVDVDSSDAVRDLRRLGDAGRDAGDDLKAGFDDAESAATKALRAISQEADRMESELKGTGDAVKAIGANLGAGFDSSKIERMVGDLRKMGLTFEQIEANAKEFADVVQRVDGIKLDAVNAGLTDVDNSMRRVHDSSDQSRSVLANLAGNAAQDLGELGGVVGTLGVGIGQLAEYAVDGNIALSNLAKVAGPMAALAAGTFLVTNAISGVRERAAAAEARMQRLNDIMAAGGDIAGAYADMLAEVGLEAEEAAPSLFDVGKEILGFDDTVKDLADDLDRAGITFRQWSRGITGSVADAQELQRAIDAAVESGRINEDQWRDLTAALAEGGEKWEQTSADVDQANRLMAMSTRDMVDALAAMRDPLTVLPDMWSTLVNDVADGTLDYENAASAVNQLAIATGLTNDEVLELVKAEADKKVEALATAAAAAAEQMANLQQAARDYRTVTTTNDWGRAGLEGAAAAFETYFTAVHGHHNDVIAQEEAWDGLGSAIDTAGTAIIDLSGPEGRATFEALQELGRSYIPAIAKAFDESNGDVETFSRSMDDLAQTTLRRLQDEFGLSADDAAYLVDAMGLIPEDIETQYKLAGDEEARIKLGLLQGVIDGLPEDVQTEVAMHILADDPQAALDAVERAVSGGVTAPMYLDTSPAMRAYNALVAAIGAAAIIAQLRLATGGARSSASAAGVPVSSSATPMMLGATPAAGFSGGGGVAVLTTPAPVTNNYRVEVKAAVIGDQHTARRWVTRALRQSDRLGSRP